MPSSEPHDDDRSTPGSVEFLCPRCGCRFALDSLTVRVAGTDRAREVKPGGDEADRALGRVVEDTARALALEALRQAGGNKARAAELAGMEYATFYQLVAALGITSDHATGEDETEDD